MVSWGGGLEELSCQFTLSCSLVVSSVDRLDVRLPSTSEGGMTIREELDLAGWFGDLI